MKKLFKLTFFQLRDKLNLSWAKSKKTLIQRIVFSILEFALLAGVTFGILYLFSFIGLLSKYSDVVPLYTVFYIVLFVLSLLSGLEEKQ